MMSRIKPWERLRHSPVRACVEVLDGSRAQVMLMTDGAHGAALAVSDSVSNTLEELLAWRRIGLKGAQGLGTVLDGRAVVHQASGMVSAQLDFSVRHALVPSRAQP